MASLGRFADTHMSFEAWTMSRGKSGGPQCEQAGRDPPAFTDLQRVGMFCTKCAWTGGSQIMLLNSHKEMGAENTPAKKLMVEGELDNAKQ